MHLVVLLEMLISALRFLLINILFLFFFGSPFLFWDSIVSLIHPAKYFPSFVSFFHSSFLSFCFFLQFLGEQLDAEGLERGFVNTENLRTFEEEETQFSMPSLEDKIPFLQMLQGVEYPPFFPLKEPNFQTLLKLQHLKRPWNNCITEADTQVQALELESCVTHDIADLHSPAKSETKDFQNPRSNSCLEDVSAEPNQRQDFH